MEVEHTGETKRYGDRERQPGTTLGADGVHEEREQEIEEEYDAERPSHSDDLDVQIGQQIEDHGDVGERLPQGILTACADDVQ